MDKGKTGFNQFFDIEEVAVGPGTPLLSPKVRHLFEWWSAHNHAGLAWRKDFDIVDHRPIVANIFVTDCLADGNFVLRLLGEEVIRIVGRNRTGETIQRGAVGEYGHALFEYYTNIVRTRRCMRCLGSLKFAGKEFARFESIDCPLTDDGIAVSRILGVIDLV